MPDFFRTEMKILENENLKVERAALDDIILHEGGELIFHDEHAAIVRLTDWHKCVFDSADSCDKYIKDLKISGDVCAMNLTSISPEFKPVLSGAYKTYAYLKPMPPEFDKSVTVKRLAPSLAGFIASEYNGCAAAVYDEAHIETLMRTKGIFGAIVESQLAGFIGMHEDGNMGMLRVFEKFRRHKIGEALEKFLISYIMTFGRVPICDVAEDNVPSIKLQEKLGLTAANANTYWIKI